MTGFEWPHVGYFLNFKKLLTEAAMDSEQNPQSIELEPQSYSLNRWMTDNYSQIKHLRISEMSLPGAHNCGMDKGIPNIDSYSACQDYGVRHQLDNGVRVLDIRLRWYQGEGFINEGMKTFHSAKSGRTFGEIMLAIHQFHLDNPGEIIVLDINRIEAYGSGFVVPYKLFYEAVLRDYGHKLLPVSALNLTFEQIKQRYPGPRIALATVDQVWTHEGPRDRTYFWDKITHQWVGDGLVSPNRLHTFMQGVMSNPPSSEYPWSMSATCYDIGGPRSTISELCQWYPTGGDWQRKSSIINFDFVSRQNSAFIRQCIESNNAKPIRDRLVMLEPSEGAVLDSNSIRVAGTGAPGADVILSLEGVGSNCGEAVVDSSGNWAMTAQFQDGTFALVCRQKLNNEYSRWTDPRVVRVDTSLPVPIIDLPRNGSTFYSSDIRVEGTGLPGAEVMLSLSGNESSFGTGKVGEDGNWAITAQFGDGTLALVCIHKLNGRESRWTEPRYINVAKNFLAPNILTPIDGSTVDTVRPWISGEGTPGATVLFYKSGTSAPIFGYATVGSSGEWGSTPSIDLPGAEFSLGCIQLLNNVYSPPSSPITFNIRLPLPEPTILKPIDGSTVDTVRPWISGEGIPGATVLFYKSGTSAPLFGYATVGSNGKWLSSPSIDLPGAEFSLSCTQLLDNVYSPPSSPITFYIRLPLPAPTILTPADGSEVDSINPVISGEGGTPGAVVRFYEQGSFNYHGQANVGESGTWRAMATTGLPPGRFTLVCNQTLGEWQSGYSAPSTFTVLDKPPAPTDLSVTPDKTSAYVEWQNSSPNVIYFLYTYSAGGEQSIFSNKVTLNNLEPDREYTFRVRSMSRDFKLSEYASITFKTSGDGGSEPTNFRVTHNANRNVSFAWDLPVEGASNVIGYIFKIFVVGNETSLGTTRVYTMNNMVPLVPVVVGVKCKFMNGTDSGWSQLTVVPSL
jgi:hypothetical protein